MKKTLIPIGLVVVFFVGVFLKMDKDNRFIVDHTEQGRINNLKLFRERWTDRIKRKGPEVAYEDLKTAFQDSPEDNQHLAAHLFGSLLYDVVQIEGVTVCDETFSFGCYHSFFSRAITERGLAVLVDLDSACIAKYGPNLQSCQHGIGHGLMEFYGGKNIVKALEGCKGLAWKEPLFGCVGGVFMAYNFPTTVEQDAARFLTRPLDASDPYAPCPMVPIEFRQACYYELGQWWEKVYQADYTTLGRLCDGIEKAREKDACFRGLGNVIAPTAQYDSQRIVTSCTFMPDMQAEALCRSEAASSVFSHNASQDQVRAICSGISFEAGTYCAKWAHQSTQDE